jgi:hypothetical protein
MLEVHVSSVPVRLLGAGRFADHQGTALVCLCIEHRSGKARALFITAYSGMAFSRRIDYHPTGRSIFCPARRKVKKA